MILWRPLLQYLGLNSSSVRGTSVDDMLIGADGVVVGGSMVGRSVISDLCEDFRQGFVRERDF